jgi:hypothetical protein
VFLVFYSVYLVVKYYIVFTTQGAKGFTTKGTKIYTKGTKIYTKGAKGFTTKGTKAYH